MENPPETNLSRRDLIKVLAASGCSVLASSLIPGRWLKPVVEAGVLPAHAQSTQTLTIALLITSCRSAGAGNYQYGPSFNFVDDLCEVTELGALTPHVWVDNGNPVSILNAGIMMSGPCVGQFSVSFRVAVAAPTSAHVSFDFQADGAPLRTTNVVDVHLMMCQPPPLP